MSVILGWIKRSWWKLLDPWTWSCYVCLQTQKN